VVQRVAGCLRSGWWGFGKKAPRPGGFSPENSLPPILLLLQLRLSLPESKLVVLSVGWQWWGFGKKTPRPGGFAPENSLLLPILLLLQLRLSLPESQLVVLSNVPYISYISYIA
jgi:hypothetical protein